MWTMKYTVDKHCYILLVKNWTRVIKNGHEYGLSIGHEYGL
jgi:hypothetical protein